MKRKNEQMNDREYEHGIIVGRANVVKSIRDKAMSAFNAGQDARAVALRDIAEEIERENDRLCVEYNKKHSNK